MKKTFKYLSQITALLLIAALITAFSLVAFAEETSDTTPTAETSSEAPTETSTESSDDTTSSEETSIDPSQQYTVAFSGANVTVYVGGNAVTTHTGTVGETLSFTVTPAEGFLVSAVTLNVFTTLTPENGVYSQKFPKNGNYSIDIETVVDTKQSVALTIVGQGTVDVNGKKATNTVGATDYTETIRLEKGTATKFTVSPAFGYKTDSVFINGINAAPSADKSYTAGPLNSNITLVVTFTPQAVTSNCTITVYCGTGGKIIATAGSVTETVAGGGGSRTITVAKGGSLSLEVLADVGYQVSALTVGGKTVTLTNGKYEISNLASNLNINASFSRPSVVDTSSAVSTPAESSADTTSVVAPPTSDVITAANINWSNSPVIIDISSITKVAADVFAKIATLDPADGYVRFEGGNAVWSVPYGAAATSAQFVDFAIVKNGGTYYTEASDLTREKFTEKGMNLRFDYFFTNASGLPAGTLISLNMGGSYSGVNTVLLSYNNAAGSIQPYYNGTYFAEVRVTGWTDNFTYPGTQYLICAESNSLQTYNVTTRAGNGGTITPGGTIPVLRNSDFVCSIKANAGYLIDKIIVDGNEIAIEEGTKSYECRELTAVISSHVIEATYKIDENYSGGPVISAIDPNISFVGESSNPGLYVFLVILFLALAGAAILFIVKWRQERY